MARQSGLKSQNWGLKYFYGSNFLLSACPPRHYRFFKVHVLIILIEHFLWGLESDVMYVDRRCVLYLFILQKCVDRISVCTMCITQTFYATIKTMCKNRVYVGYM